MQVSLDAKAVPGLLALLERLGGPHAAVARALAEIGPAARPAVPALVSLLKEPGHTVRSDAARALGSIGPDAAAALPALSRLLAQKGEEGRRLEVGPAPKWLASLAASAVGQAGGGVNPWQAGWMVVTVVEAHAGRAWAAPPACPGRVALRDGPGPRPHRSRPAYGGASDTRTLSEIK